MLAKKINDFYIETFWGISIIFLLLCYSFLNLNYMKTQKNI